MCWINVLESIISGVVAGLILSAALWLWKSLDRKLRWKEYADRREIERIEREIEFDRERLFRYRDFIVLNPWPMNKPAIDYLKEKYTNGQRPYLHEALKREMPLHHIAQLDTPL